jgi:hypothetical protein
MQEIVWPKVVNKYRIIFENVFADPVNMLIMFNFKNFKC